MSIDRGDLHMKEEIGKWWEEVGRGREKWLIEVPMGCSWMAIWARTKQERSEAEEVSET